MSESNDTNMNLNSLINQLETLKDECNAARESGDSNALPMLIQKFRLLIPLSPPSPLPAENSVSSSPLPPITNTTSTAAMFASRNGLKRSQSLVLSDERKIVHANETIKNLMDDIRKAKAKLSRPCEMCKNYELQLQSVELTVAQLMKQLSDCEEKLKLNENELSKERIHKSELEEKFIKEAKDTESQVKALEERLTKCNSDLIEMQGLFNIFFNEANEKISMLKSSNEKLKNDIKCLSAENDNFLGRYLNKSHDLQSEFINLPQDINEMQFYCLKLRENLITALSAKERQEERDRSEILFLREQQIAEQQAKEKLEENLTLENDSLRNQLEKLRKQYDESIIQYKEQETMLNQYQTRVALLLQENEQQENSIQFQSNDLTSTKGKLQQLEEDNSNLKAKVINLQNELENSEFVQRDFVKLSQSLQVQLENIRQSDVEVRWQHEEDVKECNQCHKVFHSRKEKSHCSHCGKIFCVECNSKIILGGPNRRQFKVCSVCHTLLDRDTAPYFSNEPPQTPT